MDLGLQGNIEKFTLPEILQLLAAGRKSGTLGIQQNDSIVMVYFREGTIIYGYGPRQTFHLGQLLKEKKVISEGQLEEAIRTQARTENSKRLGEILISRGYIDRADLEAVVKKQVEELLYSLLTWQSGSFKFYENQFPTDEEITVRLSVENVILEGMRRIDESNFIKETVPSLDDVYTISAAQGDRPRDISLQAPEWNVMALVDGRRTVDEVCRLSPVQPNDTLKKLAHLKLAGIITKSDKHEEAVSTELDKMVKRLADLFEEYLTEKSAHRSNSRITNSTLVELEN